MESSQAVRPREVISNGSRLKIVVEDSVYYLVARGHKIALSESEVSKFRQMTPLGRKITLRKRAMETQVSAPDDPEAILILSLFQLPARDWSFRVPD